MKLSNVIRGVRGTFFVGAMFCASAAYAGEETTTSTTPTSTTVTKTKKKTKANGDVEVKTKTTTVSQGADEPAPVAKPASAEAAPADHKPKHHTKRVVAEKVSTTAAAVEPESKPMAADNTGKNDPDKSRIGEKPTADQAKNDKSDIAIMAEIRRAVMAEKGLSTSAHNVKIIAESGVVTLKGAVKSADEKASVMQKAVGVVGVKNVRNDIEIAP